MPDAVRPPLLETWRELGKAIWPTPLVVTGLSIDSSTQLAKASANMEVAMAAANPGTGGFLLVHGFMHDDSEEEEIISPYAAHKNLEAVAEQYERQQAGEELISSPTK